MNQPLSSSPPDVFKGIALFTPGGDLIYCIDPQKRNRWHLQLCTALQSLLGLADLPHFLVPCYTATVDRWWDVQAQSIQTAAEACPRVIRYASLLNVAFNLTNVSWSTAVCPEELCDPELLDTHRTQFPELWEHHNLVLQLNGIESQPLDTEYQAYESYFSLEAHPSWPSPTQEAQRGFVLRLFVSGHNAATEATLRKLHHALETSLEEPYTLKVVDVYRNPEQAEIDQITATPTLLKVWPLPNKRIVGNLDDMDQLLSILTLNHQQGYLS